MHSSASGSCAVLHTRACTPYASHLAIAVAQWSHSKQAFTDTTPYMITTAIHTLQAQEIYIMRVAEAQRIARDEKGRKAVKEDKLKLLLQQPELVSAGGSVPMPLDPSIQVCLMFISKHVSYIYSLTLCT
jgi:hypothetical protein